MANEIPMLMRTITIALQSPPVARYAPIGAGSVQGGMIYVGETSPTDVAIYARVPVINGIVTNGMIRIGFNTIGAPKMIGSLILKIPGTILVLPSAFKYLEREKNTMARTNPRVAPDPPIQMNHW